MNILGDAKCSCLTACFKMLKNALKNGFLLFFPYWSEPKWCKKNIILTFGCFWITVNDMWVFPKIRDTPKWMVKRMENPIFLMDDLGGKTPIFWKHPYVLPMLLYLNLSYLRMQKCFVFFLRFWIPSSGAVVVLPVQKALMVIQCTSMHMNVQVICIYI